MASQIESLKTYFDETPQDILEKDWKEIEPLNAIGPDVLEYADYIKEYFGVNIPYSNSTEWGENHKFEIPEYIGDTNILADSKYLLAA